MSGPAEAERRAIEADDLAFFERHPSRLWRLRLPFPGEPGEAVAAHWLGNRVAITPAPAWTASDEAIEAIVRRALPPAALEQLEAAIARARP